MRGGVGGDESDTISTYTWSATGGTFPGGATGDSVTWQAPSEPGQYTITCTADDTPTAVVLPDTGNRNDSPGSGSVNVNVCAVTISSARSWVEYGCGATQNKAFINCMLASQCPDEEPTFSISGPLAIEAVNKASTRNYIATVVSTVPTGCSQNATIRAQASSGCISNAVALEVKSLGPFGFQYNATDPTEYYQGAVTFSQIGIDPPTGCSSDSFVYGCITRIHYTLSISCPLSADKDFYEELECGVGCDCPPTNEWHNNVSAGTSGNLSIEDDIGILTCDCFDLRLGVSTVHKTRQTLKIGDCELAKRCIDVTRQSGGNCLSLQQYVMDTEGWDGCSCETN